MRPKKASGASKKDGKKDKKDKASSSSSSSSSQSRETADEEDGAGHPQADVEDPFNLADVESRWQRSNGHHEDKLKELRRALGSGAADGSAIVDVDAIGATPVSVGTDQQHQQHQQHQPLPHKGQHKGAAATTPATATATATTPLAELALVIPRAGGRFVELRMHSAASRKAITRAVQASPLFHGQQPQPDPDDELVLLIRTGSPHEGGTAGSSEAAAVAAERVRRVSDLANAWRAQIRRATARRQKTHQTWKKDGSVRPDDLHRLDRDLLRGQDKHLARIDTAEKDTLRQLERTGRR